MLHDRHPVPADNDQIFLAEDVEQILNDYYSTFINENGFQERRYSEEEILENYSISRAELERMKYRLSYDYNHKKVN